MEFYDLDIRGVLALRNAVIKMAAEDYMRHYVKGASVQPIEVRKIEKWFLSPQFETMGISYSGRWFVDNLRKMGESGDQITTRKIVKTKGTTEANRQWM